MNSVRLRVNIVGEDIIFPYFRRRTRFVPMKNVYRADGIRPYGNCFTGG